MLGKLFSTAASSLNPRGQAPSASRPSTSLESVQEDIHTRNLLFPDAETLYAHQHDQVFPLTSSTVPIFTSSSNAFDVNPEIDLDFRDVRVVIMQDSASSINHPATLYDSHPLIEPQSQPDRQSTTSTSQRTARQGSISSPRRISLGQASKPVIITQDNSTARNFSAFDRRPSTHIRTGSYIETEGQRSAREFKEEMATISTCMFGASEIIAFKGTGTKVHIIPVESKASSYPFEGHGSLGRSSIRSSRLAQSFTSETIGPTQTSSRLPIGGSGSSDKRRVLITRIFPVALGNSDAEDQETPHNASDDAVSGYPFPSMASDGKIPKKKPQQKRTPMYAIGLVIQLPATAPTSPLPTNRSTFRSPSSYTDHESFPSSFSSLKPAGWTVLGHGFGVESLESSFHSEGDDRIDAITQHWDVIIRSLNHLQAVATTKILAMLKQVDIASPAPITGSLAAPHTRTASVSVAGKRVEETLKDIRQTKGNIKTVHLTERALSYDDAIKAEVDSVRHRIVGGIKTLQVITSQGRWGIWREEARWVGKWAGGKAEGFFFFNLLTAFLGNHPEWLKRLAPMWYRRRAYQQQRAGAADALPLAGRTVIISHDKMAARRLIFLLSAFLSNNQQQQLPFVRHHRPSTGTSFGGYSQSPPSYAASNAKEESLRRKLNRLNRRDAHSRTMSFPAQQTGSERRPGHMLERRNSDAFKTANLPIPGSDGGTRKSSAATTTTVTPIATIPHFSTRRPIRGTGPLPRPGSSGSLAADDLIRSLKRGDSTGSTDSQGQSRWGSVIGSFWSGKRRGSTYATDVTAASLEGLSIEESEDKLSKSKLDEMVDEAQRLGKDVEDNKPISNGDKQAETPPEQTTKSPEPEPQAVYPGGDYESPVKTSINEDDGVIDIDVPLPDFLTSSFGGSTISSPSSSGFLSSHSIGPGLEGFEHYSRSGADDDNPINAAGWISRYHPDFVLQAIPAERQGFGLEEEIKASMRAEPTPKISSSSVSHDEETRWVDITSTLVADASNFSIKRVRLRRLIKLPSFSDREADYMPNSFDSRTQSLYGNPYMSGPLTPYVDTGSNVIEEEFIEEPVMSMDEGLIEAVERIIAITTPALGPPSTSSGRSSRSPSRVRNTDAGHGGDENTPRENNSRAGPATKKHEATLEVPRNQCKKILLNALEDIAQEVADSYSRNDTVPALPKSDPNSRHSVSVRPESFLREGIRTWLTRVEETP